MKKANRELIGIDIFAGAGGLSLGAELAGITMRYAVEFDQHAAASYRRNFEHATVFHEDIRKLSTEPMKAEPVFIIMGGLEKISAADPLKLPKLPPLKIGF